MGVANNKSIAWGCAKAMKDQGATLIYTYQNERMEKQLAKLAEPEDLLIECDVTNARLRILLIRLASDGGIRFLVSGSWARTK